MRLISFLILILLPFIFQTAFASTQKMVRCKNGKIIRTIEIQKKNDGSGCETVYTKDGVPKAVGFGQNKEGCDLVLTNVQNNLTKAGWKCSDITQSFEVAQ